MLNLLTAKQKAHYDQFLAFAEEHVEPYANQWDLDERIPQDIIDKSAKAGFLGGALPATYKGQEWDFCYVWIAERSYWPLQRLSERIV
ncbi:acyl-CoA dehydrogenase family protein [Brevibacillus laterosporus]|uniref:Acyl-CoA dehydrogenase family protein n=1 Tax=Brevibacillus laterosporus TaxID=1465 RepID=A0AAP3G9U5_BRELA|nr:acyl-CoA dehydrogenase family protein [Brevibacillus laterosporus]MCR8982787.1 acyl-CoA dehydrogenase family protein [Brevibacillus laterosporus]MCZ0809943.1 acyl-CoA dehydrogenase family protein [Brevibacillus laterosporus]MCZ0828569.1 acyl-CoA dehydrogenase family protein [Brevibacillus laterosporus]MCZ0852631.1 acyl-CoA dehydrogenase family protein [Brevibacillus laterosporus]